MKKEKMTTFMAMDVLNCSMKFINLYIKHIKDHQKVLERMLDKFEIEADPGGMDGEFVVSDYVWTLQDFMKHSELITEKLDNYLQGRGVSNMEVEE